jgi:hypothetical protein
MTVIKNAGFLVSGQSTSLVKLIYWVEPFNEMDPVLSGILIIKSTSPATTQYLLNIGRLFEESSTGFLFYRGGSRWSVGDAEVLRLHI